MLGCKMTFSVYLPPAATQKAVPVSLHPAKRQDWLLPSNLLAQSFSENYQPSTFISNRQCPSPPRSFPKVVYYLSGLTCTDDNVMQKSGAQRKAAELGLALVAPDTSPRGLGIPGEDDAYDFGTGAGFYLNATQEQWKRYRMYDYVLQELPQVLGDIKGLDLTKARASTRGSTAWDVGLTCPAWKACVDCPVPCAPRVVETGHVSIRSFTILGSSEAIPAPN